MNIHTASVSSIFKTLRASASKPFSPVLLCLPDVLLLRDKKEPVRSLYVSEMPERISIELGWGLDGHACISAMTAGFLAVGLYADFETWLAAKVGQKGRDLLSKVEIEIGNYAGGMFKCFLQTGDDRHIETPTNTDKEVTREIEIANINNQLSYSEFDAFGLLPWLNNRSYGLLIGDAESYLLTESFDDLKHLCSKAAAVVVDTSVFKKEPLRSKKLWESVCKIASLNSRTLVSISDKDANDLARCLGFSDNAKLGQIASCLQKSLPDGNLILHTWKLNAAFWKDSSKSPVILPTFDITPVKGTNGAGDTFNGGLALAAMAIGREKPQGAFSAFEIEQALKFATIVASLRLETGNYPTRAEIMAKAMSLTQKTLDGADFESLDIQPEVSLSLKKRKTRQPTRETLFFGWDDLPKIFLIDLDHTLCDSKTWRTHSTIQAVKTLGLQWSDNEILRVYEYLYKNHDAFKDVLEKNLRYCWNLENLFYLFIYLDMYPCEQRLQKIQIEERTIEEIDRNRLNLLENISSLKLRSDIANKVALATSKMKEFPAFPYSDAVASLYRIRDVLKFDLYLVTEGDAEAQKEKIVKLGLSRLFNNGKTFQGNLDQGNQIIELAFPSEEQLKYEFMKLLLRLPSGLEKEAVIEAQEICIDIQNTLKQSFRGRALYYCIQKFAAKKGNAFGKASGNYGVYICTLGDRVDTDVVPYIKLKEKMRKLGSDPGMVVARLKRGPYEQYQDNVNHEKPDISVDSFSFLTEMLAQPGFWRGKLPIRSEDLRRALPRADKLEHGKKDTLLRVAAFCPMIRPIIDGILQQLGLLEKEK